ncbi:metallophosphoesterase [Phycisphaerales bacterium AB-hyl4]|uniref:Metallophosphoesterase n=1 Tax=Natronomicrosphaera hydrolytica TaxID=3242702 RepID=A0ABV4U5U4_9BACT
MNQRQTSINRRAFLAESTGALMGAALLGQWGLPSQAVASEASGAQGWSFVLLGDLHYDLWEHHDMDWVKREKPRSIRQIEGYVRVTTELYPHLGAEIRQVIAGTPNPVDYVINIGDFVQGLCGSYDLQMKQFEDALDWIRQSRWGAPYLMTIGNHDITGPGAREAYEDKILPYMSRQINQRLDSSNFIVEHRNAMFVFVDAYDRGRINPWLEEALRQRSAEHLFVIVHQPVVPYHGQAAWAVYGQPGQEEDRQKFLNMLGEHEAIVLSGHLHRYGLVRRHTQQGRFVELAMNSIIRSKDHEARRILKGVEHRPDMEMLEPDFSSDTDPTRGEHLRAERQAIDQFETGQLEGYGMVQVNGGKVSVDLYNGLGRRKWKTLDLTSILKARRPADAVHLARP